MRKQQKKKKKKRKEKTLKEEYSTSSRYQGGNLFQCIDSTKDYGPRGMDTLKMTN
jgi:hypothetical protein